MKIRKYEFTKKLIIILIVLLIFNIAVPKKVKAWDFAGILMKPLTTLIVGYMLGIDAQIGMFLLGIDGMLDVLGDAIEAVTGDSPDWSTSVGDGNTISDVFIGPDTIFAGQVKTLNANIFEAGTQATSDDSVKIGPDGLVSTLKQGIATTYVALRNVCAMLMLAGLLFTGIRVLVTSNNPSKRAAWLQLVYDWLVGMMLLICSHVIMYGIFWISDTITDVLRQSLIGVGGMNLALAKKCISSVDSAEQIISLVMLGYMIYLTVIFAIAYFKRLMWVCVLIVIAPIVSIMYAFGNQTKQIYTRWIREYITTVLVQPFHMITYYTLVSIPMNMASSSSQGYSSGINSTFTVIYALGAMSFIRPAEKYIRQLFGMHQGIAAMASFDSGKQTFDAMVEAVKKVVVVAGTAAAAVATGGTSLAASGAAAGGSAAAAGGGATSLAGGSGATSLLGKGATEMAGEMAGGMPGLDNPIPGLDAPNPRMGIGDPSFIGETNADNLLADTPGQDIYGLGSSDPFHDDFFAGDQWFDNDLQNDQLNTGEDKSEAALQSQLDSMFGDDNPEERAAMEEELRQSGWGDQPDSEGQQDLDDAQVLLEAAGTGADPDGVNEPAEGEGETFTDEKLSDVDGELEDLSEALKDSKKDSTEQAKNNLNNDNNNDDKSKNINAENVIINGENIKMQGQIDPSALEIINEIDANIDGDAEENSDSTEGAEENLDSTEDAEEKLGDTTKKLAENEANIGISENKNGKENPINKEREKDDFLVRGKKAWNAISEVTSGESTPLQAYSKLSEDSLIRKIPQKIGETEKMQKAKEGEYGKGIQKLTTDIPEKIKAFDELGGFKEIHAGFNSVRDTFYADAAPASGDWKQTNERMGETVKDNMDRTKEKISHNPEFKNKVEQKYYLKLKEQYKDNKNYNDARLMAMAKEKAEPEIKRLTDTYVPLAIKDPNLILELDKDCKDYGISPKEAIQQRAQYENFNINSQNISYINSSYNENVKSVKEAIPEARNYYNNGYDNIRDMARVDELTTLLRVTPEYGMKLDRILEKKGNTINLNLDKRKDLDDEQKNKIQSFIKERYVDEEKK